MIKRYLIVLLSIWALTAGVGVGQLLAECCSSGAGSCGDGYDCCICCENEISCWNCSEGQVCGDADCVDGNVKIFGTKCKSSS